MASLREIKKRIHSIENIKQITRSMEMVAAARLPKAVIKAKHHEIYVTHLFNFIQKLSSATKNVIHPFFSERKPKKSAFIIIGADKGMSGSYNNNLFIAIEKKLKNYSPENIELYLFGRKVIDYYKRKKWDVKEKIENWGGKITSEEIELFFKKIIEAYLNQKIDEVILVYTKYINAFSMQIQFDKLLSFTMPKESEENTNFILEPNAEELFTKILPQYCMVKLESIMSHSYASELSARVFAMSAANKNAEEMIEKLTIIRNKVRQTNITNEMLEIAGGAEGLKS